jgi:hypothetical protein
MWPRRDALHYVMDNTTVLQKVLAEPFPGTVIQGVILVFVIVNSQLYSIEMD